jgi:hypothetical protein
VPLRLGATTIPNRTYDGWVDEAAFYGGALSATQIAAHYSAATTNNSGYSTQILASHPLGYWRLEETLYTAAAPVAVNVGSLAPIGNGIYEPGALPGASGVPAGAFGANNYACQFNAAGYIDIPGAYLNPTGPLTLSAWVKVGPATGGSQTILSKGSPAYLMSLDGSGLPHFADGAQPAGDVVGPNRVDDGQWHQWIGAYDGINSEYLYIDGQLVASANSATAPIVANGNDLLIGADPGASAQFFSGVIDEVAIFTNLLTSAQIGHLYDTAVAPVFQNTAATGGAVLLSWSAIVGRTYQLQFKTNVNQTTWSNLLSVVATSATATASDSLASAPRKFYRAVLLP